MEGEGHTSSTLLYTHTHHTHTHSHTHTHTHTHITNQENANHSPSPPPPHTHKVLCTLVCVVCSPRFQYSSLSLVLCGSLTPSSTSASSAVSVCSPGWEVVTTEGPSRGPHGGVAVPRALWPSSSSSGSSWAVCGCLETGRNSTSSGTTPFAVKTILLITVRLLPSVTTSPAATQWSTCIHSLFSY